MRLNPHYFGPHHIMEKVGSVAYKLALPSSFQIHNVFHVNLLREQLGLVTPASNQLLPIFDTLTIIPQPDVVLDRCVICNGKYCLKFKILVKWVGALAKYATWANEWRFTKSYPDFILVDKDP